MELIHGVHLRNLRGDLLGGITAVVVALPAVSRLRECCARPRRSHLRALRGAVVVGFVAALLGGTPAQVSGPTGPMSVTVAGVVSSLATVGSSRDLMAGEILPLLVMAAVVLGGGR